MTATTFTTQRQLMSKNMPKDALTGPYAQQQKMLLYVLPVVFAVGGIAFPIGVLFYWTTSNLWTMGQQFYVIRNNPAPGTEAGQAQGGAGREEGSSAPPPGRSRWSGAGRDRLAATTSSGAAGSRPQPGASGSSPSASRRASARPKAGPTQGASPSGSSPASDQRAQKRDPSADGNKQ